MAQEQFDPVIRLTVPLEITIRLGTPEMGGLPTRRNDQEPAPEPQTLDGVLGEVRRAESRPYYNEEEDAADRRSYYGAEIENLNGSALYDFLSELVTRTHDNKLGYSPSSHLYPWVDRQPDLSLKSLYTAETFAKAREVEAFVREEFRKEESLRKAVDELHVREGLANPAALAQEVSRLEAAVSFNCEHVVPQSWFNKRSPMRGDLHHLFACESKCNGFRGNLPFYDFTDFEEKVSSGCGKSDVSDSRNPKFEPANGKGEAARATLYFLLRYPGEVGNETKEMQRDRLPVILEWARRPVTRHELHRNAAIREVQGNRNPFIDFPNLIERIDMDRAFAG